MGWTAVELSAQEAALRDGALVLVAPADLSAGSLALDSVQR